MTDDLDRVSAERQALDQELAKVKARNVQLENDNAACVKEKVSLTSAKDRLVTQGDELEQVNKDQQSEINKLLISQPYNPSDEEQSPPHSDGEHHSESGHGSEQEHLSGEKGAEETRDEHGATRTITYGSDDEDTQSMSSQGRSLLSPRQRSRDDAPVSFSEDEDGKMGSSHLTGDNLPPLLEAGQGDSVISAPIRAGVAHHLDQEGIPQLLSGPENAIPGEPLHLLVGHRQVN